MFYGAVNLTRGHTHTHTFARIHARTHTHARMAKTSHAAIVLSVPCFTRDLTQRLVQRHNTAELSLTSHHRVLLLSLFKIILV